MKKLNHPNIIRLHEIIDDPKEQNIYMIMDLIPGGTIDSHLTKTKNGLPHDKLWKWARHIISALKYCHEIAKICHRDLKAENFMLDAKENAILCDFGISSVF